MTTDDAARTVGEPLVDPPADEHRPRRRGRDAAVLVVVALVAAVLLKAFVVQAFYIPSGSMHPGLVEDDRIVVQKVSYWFGGSPERGDVVVFEDPGGWLTEDADEPGPVGRLLGAVGLRPRGDHLVKRVIGVGGDTVVCCDAAGLITVNGEPLDEEAQYIAPLEGASCHAPMVPCGWSAVVPEGELFVMGDNRAHSGDSTVHLCLPRQTECAKDPFVPVDLVTGKVLAVLWPAGHARFVADPDGFDDVPDPAGPIDP